MQQCGHRAPILQPITGERMIGCSSNVDDETHLDPCKSFWNTAQDAFLVFYLNTSSNCTTDPPLRAYRKHEHAKKFDIERGVFTPLMYSLQQVA